ncbi:MAG: hypothetical protein AB7P23_09095, partial [Amphiplicatus sp.]
FGQAALAVARPPADLDLDALLLGGDSAEAVDAPAETSPPELRAAPRKMEKRARAEDSFDGPTAVIRRSGPHEFEGFALIAPGAALRLRLGGADGESGLPPRDFTLAFSKPDGFSFAFDHVFSETDRKAFEKSMKAMKKSLEQTRNAREEALSALRLHLGQTVLGLDGFDEPLLRWLDPGARTDSAEADLRAHEEKRRAARKQMLDRRVEALAEAERRLAAERAAIERMRRELEDRSN